MKHHTMQGKKIRWEEDAPESFVIFECEAMGQILCKGQTLEEAIENAVDDWYSGGGPETKYRVYEDLCKDNNYSSYLDEEGWEELSDEEKTEELDELVREDAARRCCEYLQHEIEELLMEGYSIPIGMEAYLEIIEC